MSRVELRTCVRVPVRAGSQRWLAERRKGIGASEIASVLGIAPQGWGSPYSLYMLKRGEVPPDVDNARMRWGNALERTILNRFLQCHPEFRDDSPLIAGHLYRSTARPWQLATPDGVVFDARISPTFDDSPLSVGFTHRGHVRYGYPVVVQVKTGASRHGWGAEGTDDIPVYYRAQVMQEMDVVGARVAWVPVLFNGSDYREYRVEYDKKDARILRARGAAFWENVKAGKPPPTDGYEATGRALRRAFDVNQERRVQVPADLIDRLERAKRLQRRAKTLRDKYENEVRALMGDAAVGMAGAAVVARRTAYDQRYTDLEALRVDHPELVEKYTTPVPRTRFTSTDKEL